MKEVETLLQVFEDASIKRSAGIGAGVGAALGLRSGNVLFNTALGAGVGTLLGYALKASQSTTSVSPADASVESKSEPE